MSADDLGWWTLEFVAGLVLCVWLKERRDRRQRVEFDVIAGLHLVALVCMNIAAQRWSEALGFGFLRSCVHIAVVDLIGSVLSLRLLLLGSAYFATLATVGLFFREVAAVLLTQAHSL